MLQQSPECQTKKIILETLKDDCCDTCVRKANKAFNFPYVNKLSFDIKTLPSQ